MGERRPVKLTDVGGLLGASLWALTILLRESPAIHDPNLQFWLGITPNFGVGLLLPMLVANFYPVLFKKELTHRLFLYSLAMVLAALFLSEVVHALFLDSAFDIFDLLASFVAVAIMVWLSNYRKISRNEAADLEILT
jgi:hypothetical protein